MHSRSWTRFLGLLLQSLVVLAVGGPDVKQILLRTHSLQPPYLDSEMQSRWFDFGADAIVRTDKYIRLTGELPSRTGWVFSRVPLTATMWEIEVEFKIHGEQSLYGDGMAMWLTKQRGQSGQVFGFQDKFEGLGIFIDTYKNNRPGTVFPYVMAMMGDGQTTYDKDNDGKANELAGCSARGIRNAAVPTKLRLTYSKDKSLKLDLQYNAEGQWEDCFTAPNVNIPSIAYLGFTAETGELSDNHDLIRVEAKNLYHQDDGPTGSAEPNGAYKSKKKGKSSSGGGGGGWLWFFFKFLLFGTVVAGSYVGFTAYRAQRNRSRF